MCVWGNAAHRGYKKSQHQLVVARGLGTVREMLGYVGTARWGFAILASRREEVDSHSFGGNRNYEQSLGRHSASQASVECSVTSARQKGDTKRLQG